MSIPFAEPPRAARGPGGNGRHPLAIVFDVDGTLLDSVPLYCRVLDATLDRLGLPPVSSERARAIMAHSRPLFADLLNETVADPAGWIETCQSTFVELWTETFCRELTLLPAAVPTLECLVAQGFRLGIATGYGGSEVVGFLGQTGVLGLVETVVTRAEVAHLKPAPDLLLEAARRMDIEPRQAAYVGDSPMDILASRAAGMASIAVLTGTGDRAGLLEHEPDLLLNHLGELPAALARFGPTSGAPWR